VAGKKTTRKATTKTRSGRKQARRKQATKASKRQRIPLSGAAERVTSILKDVGQRPGGELADELTEVLAVPAEQWPTRAAELLGRGFRPRRLASSSV
jgi:hypothetical protein